MLGILIKILNVLLFRGVGSGASVFFAVLASRHLAPEDAGRIFLLINIVAIVSVCIRWGLDEVIIRRVAVSVADNRHAVVHRMLGISHRRVLRLGGIALLLFPGLYFVDQAMAVYGLAKTEWVFAFATSFFLALLACIGRVLQGLGRTNLSIFVLNILVPGAACLWMLACVWLKSPLSLLSIMGEYFASILLAYAALLAWAAKNYSFRFFGSATVAPDSDRQDLHSANRLGFVVLAQQSLMWGSALLVPALFDSAIYAVFVVSQKLAMLISFVMLAVNFTFSSKMALLFEKKDLSGLSRLVSTAGVFVLAVSFFVAAVMLYFRAEVIAYTHVSYEGAGTLLAILVVSQVFNALSAFFSVVLSMARQEKFLMHCQLSGNFLGLGLFSALAVGFDIMIASAAFVLTYLGLSLALLYRVYRLLNGAAR